MPRWMRRAPPRPRSPPAASADRCTACRSASRTSSMSPACRPPATPRSWSTTSPRPTRRWSRSCARPARSSWASSSTHEFAIGGPSFDLPFPPARNPWNPDHHPGGSSSGSGAGVCAGLFPLALGTDTGGSVRNPACACGIVGLKPTYGLVSRRGVFPLSFTLDHVGPMTRTVADNALLLDAIAGHDPADPGSAADAARGISAACWIAACATCASASCGTSTNWTSRRIPRSPPRWRTRRACCRPRARRCAPSRCRR